MAKQIDTRAVAKQEKEDEIKRARLQKAEEERKLNRKINFFVMREVWNIIRGRATKEMDVNRTIYEVFGIRRERYSRAIDIGVIRLTKDEMKELVKKTGVENAIFEGKKCFQFENITRKEWEELFGLRENIKAFNKAAKNTIAKITEKDLKNGTNLYNLSMYFKFGISTTAFSLENIVSQLEQTKFEQLDDCKVEVLEKYLNVLDKQTNIVAAIVQYKKLKFAK